MRLNSLKLCTYPARTALFFAPAALAHAGGHHLETAEVMRWWTWEPGVVLPLAITGVLYAVGLVRLWKSAGWNHGIRFWQATAFVAGWLALVIALVSPLDALGGILSSAHMAQNELLMIVAAPLLVLGHPLIAFLWALPASWRGPVARSMQARPVTAVWQTITGALFATIAHGLALWIWHLPSLDQATLRSESIHALQNASFLVTAMLFWWALIHGRYGRLVYVLTSLFVVLVLIVSGGCNRQEKSRNMAATGGGDADHGKQLIDKYGCTSCHAIPGVAGPKGMVGPPLDHIATRQIIAGKVQNTPENMMHWLENPQALDPLNAMPNLGVTPQDSRDITAYLFTLK